MPRRTLRRAPRLCRAGRGRDSQETVAQSSFFSPGRVRRASARAVRQTPHRLRTLQRIHTSHPHGFSCVTVQHDTNKHRNHVCVRAQPQWVLAAGSLVRRTARLWPLRPPWPWRCWPTTSRRVVSGTTSVEPCGEVRAWSALLYTVVYMVMGILITGCTLGWFYGLIADLRCRPRRLSFFALLSFVSLFSSPCCFEWCGEVLGTKSVIARSLASCEQFTEGPRPLQSGLHDKSELCVPRCD